MAGLTYKSIQSQDLRTASATFFPACFSALLVLLSFCHFEPLFLVWADAARCDEELERHAGGDEED